jgi:hypothetical protein
VRRKLAIAAAAAALSLAGGACGEKDEPEVGTGPETTLPATTTPTATTPPATTTTPPAQKQP